MELCINEVNLVGALSADPEVRNIGDGRAVCNLRVATTASWKDRATGETKTRTTYHQVVIFNNEAVAEARKLKSGCRVTLRGELQNRKWEDRWITEVVVQGFDGKLIPHSQNSGMAAPAKKYPGRQSHDDFDLDDSVAWLE